MKKIICTLGPNSLNKKFLNFSRRNIDLLRLNMSHIDIQDLEKKIKFIRRHTNTPICIDTEGAQIRTKCLKTRKLKIGDLLKISQASKHFHFYPECVFHKLKKNDILEIGFNDLKVKIVYSNRKFKTLLVINTGKLENNKGVHLSNRKISLNYLTDKDNQALKIGKKLDIKHFASIKIEVVHPAIINGPPCLEVLCSEGFPEGSRNNGLYNLGVYLKKAFPDNWQEQLGIYNSKYMTPPLGPQEVMNVIKSLGKKDYNYTCKDQPICAHCDSATCQTRDFGIGDGGSLPDLNSLRKLTCSPPIWFLNVNGKPVELNTEELQKQDKFQNTCMDQINLVVPGVSKIVWTKILKQLFKNLEEIEAPESLSIKEQLRGHLEDFCTNRAMGKVKEDLNRGVPFTEEGETYFRYKDFWKFLERNKWKALEHNTTAHRLEEYFGVKEQRIRIYGMSVRVMVVKAFERPKDTNDPLPPMKKGSF